MACGESLEGRRDWLPLVGPSTSAQVPCCGGVSISLAPQISEGLLAVASGADGAVRRAALKGNQREVQVERVIFDKQERLRERQKIINVTFVAINIPLVAKVPLEQRMRRGRAQGRPASSGSEASRALGLTQRASIVERVLTVDIVQAIVQFLSRQRALGEQLFQLIDADGPEGATVEAGHHFADYFCVTGKGGKTRARTPAIKFRGQVTAVGIRQGTVQK
ncbi:hypothetical protein [Caballeronia arvi]|uniref:hypothetical protein n=1 Tax=Caballeronia arvi TaxID=1777135 RepID=UPI00190E905E|nr:hypothetical protein [Caballeronia arvi]